MKKTIIIFLISLCAQVGLSQSNIIANGGFENVYEGYPAGKPPTTESPYGNYYSDENFGNNQDYWSKIEGWTYPQAKVGCFQVTSADVLANIVESYHDAHTGDKYGHCAAGEYLINPFTAYMQPDHLYYIEFYVMVGAGLDAANSVGMRFFRNRPKICGNGTRPDPEGVAHLTVPISLPSGEWTRYSYIYKPSENWEWICLGDFANNKNDQTLTYWDDIKIIDLGTENCPYEWVWENTVFNDIDYAYQASGFIYAGSNDYNADGISGPVLVKANSKILFRAPEVEVGPGFDVEDGAYFEMDLSGCQEHPCPGPPDLPNEYFVCGTSPITLGVPSASPGIFFNWSPATNLSDPTVCNPVFTPPAGVGQIEYIVTITSVCDAFTPIIPFIQERVVVGWDHDPNPVPAINLSNITTGDYNFSFDAAVDPHTENICIRLTESGTGNVYGPICIYNFDDFSCCNITYTYDDLPYLIKQQLSACRDYTIEVTTKNFCFDNTDSKTFFWDRNNILDLTMVPNIVTLPNPTTGFSNGLNDNFCISAVGADSYHLTVSATWGIVHQSGGHIIVDPMCIWNGRCTSFPPCTESYLSTGTYAVMVEVENGCGASETYNDYVVIAYDEETRMAQVGGGMGTGEGTAQTLLHAENNNKLNEDILVFPNPAQNNFELVWQGSPVDAEIRIINALGEVVYYESISAFSRKQYSGFQTGVYLIELSSAQGKYTRRLVISK